MVDGEAPLETPMRAFGYTAPWLRAGLIDREYLEVQIAEFLSVDDPHLEHYRYGAFRRFLHGRTEFTNDEIRELVAAANNDPDGGMSGAMLVDLINDPRVSEAQFEMVAGARQGESIEREVNRARLKRALMRDITDQAALDGAITLRNSALHRWLIDRPDLPRHAVERLVVEGRSKAIRNLAIVRLRRLDGNDGRD